MARPEGLTLAEKDDNLRSGTPQVLNHTPSIGPKATLKAFVNVDGLPLTGLVDLT